MSSSFSGVYPIGSGHAYIFEFSPIIAASVVDANGFRKHIISDGTIGLTDNSPEGTPWGFEPLTGYANPNQENLAMSDNENSWPDTWPNRHQIGMVNGMGSTVNMLEQIRNHILL